MYISLVVIGWTQEWFSWVNNFLLPSLGLKIDQPNEPHTSLFVAINILCSDHRKLREDLAFREQMFQEMQQMKDNEISSIKQMKRDVEMRLENVLDPEKGEFE